MNLNVDQCIQAIKSKFSQLPKTVEYADIRVHLLDQEEHFSTLKGQLHDFQTTEKFGFGVRVLNQGAWGFSSFETWEDLHKAFDQAVELARAASSYRKDKIKLAPKESYQDSFSSPINMDPFSIATEEKIHRLMKLDKKLENEKFELWGCNLGLYKKHVLYMDTEGSIIEKHILNVEYGHSCSTTDKDGFQQRRSYTMPLEAQGSVGWENILDSTLDKKAEDCSKELLELLEAPICEEEVCDIILLPEMMALQTHETIGHALELDRILGYELSYAGGSHIDLQDFDELQFGSTKLTARADGSVINSPGSIGYDDDGIKGIDVPLIEKGKLKSAITSRQMIVEANEKAGKTIFKESGGANRAESYNKLPIERMNNINIDFGDDGSLEDLIKNTKNGLLVESPRSWSIGSNRENFHFACEIGWKITDGKISHIVRNPTYHGDSLKFWHSLSGVGDQSTWEMQQVYNCGKGQPNQIMRLGHGVPICKFENVNVGNQ